MMRAIWMSGVFAALTALGCSISPVPDKATDPGMENGAAVDLEASFAIPRTEGSLPSHTPALRLSPESRLLAVTSEGEIVAFDADRRDLVWRHRIGESAPDVVSIDAAGRRLAWGPDDGGLAVMNLEDRTILVRKGSVGASRVAMSPDGERVAVAKGPALSIRDARTLHQGRDLGRRAGDITGLAWSPDGRRIASIDLEGRLTVQDVGSGTTVHASKKDGSLHAVAYHPEGRAVAYGGKDNVVWQYVFSTEREEEVTRNQPYWITCLGYSPDGSMLAVGDESCDIWLFRLDTREMTFHSKHHEECWLTEVAWNASGTAFLFGCRPNRHDETPTTYEPLIRTEAARAEQVRKRRQALIMAIDAELPKTDTEELRADLMAFKRALTRKGGIRMQEVPIATSIIGEASEQTGATVGAMFTLGEAKAVIDDEAGYVPELKTLPQDVQALAQAHRKALAEEVKRLKESFRIHAWKVRR